MRAVGVCGSDLHRFNCDWPLTAPLTLGHEAVGVVEAVGRSVLDLAVGDAVVIEPAVPCRRCAFCLEGRYNLCRGLKSVPLQIPGAFAEYIVFDAGFTYRLPKGIDPHTGTLTEPLAVALRGIEQAEAKPGRTAAVLGVGVIGLLSVMGLRAYGVTDIIAADFAANRLRAAESAGATHMIDLTGAGLVGSVEALTSGKGVDIVIEASGNAKSAAATPLIVAPGGVIVQVGVVPGEVQLDFGELLRKEAVLKQSFKYRNNFQTALSLIQAGLPVESLITHTFPFERLEEALAFTMDHPGECLKTLIVFD